MMKIWNKNIGLCFSHQYIYQQYNLYKYMLSNTTCTNILYKNKCGHRNMLSKSDENLK
jgi:hypothetical protein